MVKPQMTYQQYVKARSAHMKQQGSTLSGADRMKQIANEWNSKGRGIAMMGGSFMDILKELPGLIIGGQVKRRELVNNKQKKMTGHGAKLNKLKKYALKIGLPLATVGAIMALNRGGIDMQSGFDSRNFQPFVDVEMERNTPAMDEDQITGLGLKKKNKKKMSKKQMEGEGFFDFIGDIQDGIKGAFGNPTNPTDVITKTAGMTLSALPFIL